MVSFSCCWAKLNSVLHMALVSAWDSTICLLLSLSNSAHWSPTCVINIWILLLHSFFLLDPLLLSLFAVLGYTLFWCFVYLHFLLCTPNVCRIRTELYIGHLLRPSAQAILHKSLRNMGPIDCIQIHFNASFNSDLHSGLILITLQARTHLQNYPPSPCLFKYGYKSHL